MALEDFDWPAHPPSEAVESFAQQSPVQTTPNITWRAPGPSTASSSSAQPVALSMRAVHRSQETPLPDTTKEDDYYLRFQRQMGVSEQPSSVQNLPKLAVLGSTVSCFEERHACDANATGNLQELNKVSRSLMCT